MSAKGLPWFRMYCDFLEDPKILSLAFEDQRHFIGVLALKSSGVLDQTCSEKMMNRIVAQKLWISHDDVDDVKRRLCEAGLIDEDWQPLAWDKRQFVSDRDPTGAERQRRYREKTRNALRDAPVTPPDTDPDTDTEPEGIGGITGTHHEGVPDPDLPPPANRADPNKARANEITAMLRKRGAALQAQDPRVLAWAAEGVSDAQLLTALDLAQRRRADQQSAQPVNAGFLDTLLREPAPRAANGSNGRKSFDPSAYINQRIHDEPEATIIDGECQRLA